MTLVWTEDLSIGVDYIDSQHKAWFENANLLFEAGKKGETKEFIPQILDFLDDYSKKHFSDEEAYMLSIHYPDYEAQKTMHATFAEELAKLKHEFKETGGSISLVVAINQLVVIWLTRHIANEDKKIGLFANMHSG